MGTLDGRVVAITGAAGGLGSAYARECARQGARLVLNDLGTSRDGSGNDPTRVQAVVDEVWLSAGRGVCDATGQVFFVRGGELKVLQGWRYDLELDRDDRWTVDALADRFAGHEWDRTPRA